METTSERLLEISAELFAESGFTGVSMRQIASAAGLTQAAIYHHYANKKDLYTATVQHLQRSKLGFVKLISEMEASPEEKLARLVELILEVLESEQAFRHIFIREMLEGDESRLQSLSEDVLSEGHKLMDPLMKEVAPGLDSQLLLTSVIGLAVHHIEARKLAPFLPGGRAEKTQRPKLAKHITALLLNGVRGS